MSINVHKLGYKDNVKTEISIYKAFQSLYSVLSEVGSVQIAFSLSLSTESGLCLAQTKTHPKATTTSWLLDLSR